MMENLFEIRNFTVEVAGKQVVRGVDLKVGKGEIHALMGPNGSGKTMFCMAIIGHPNCKVSGEIVFEGVDISGKDIAERAKMGIAIAYQSSPEIPGVKLRDLIRKERNHEPWDPYHEPEEKIASPYLERVGLRPEAFLRRDINVGFSGGERKRSELSQILAMEPRLMILDEIDSGVDIDSLHHIGEELEAAIEETGSSVLIITHYRHILKYLKPTVIHVMCNGEIVTSGPPEDILSTVEKKGYESYLTEGVKGA
jgi:Fe-S cluster assembly ATP-binding protein